MRLNPKAEGRSHQSQPGELRDCGSEAFGFRISAFFRPSDFGFRTSYRPSGLGFRLPVTFWPGPATQRAWLPAGLVIWAACPVLFGSGLAFRPRTRLAAAKTPFP